MPSLAVRGRKRLRPDEDPLERTPVGLLQRLAEVEKTEGFQGSTVPWFSGRGS